MTTPATIVPISGQRGRRVAYDALRSAIAKGELIPAQRLVEQELAGRFNVTRSSIRAALMTLSSEGLVDHLPNRGSVVRVVTIQEAVAITEVRMQLEGLLAAKAAVRATPVDRAELSEIGAAMQAAVSEGRASDYAQLNIRLHTKVRDIAQQSVAAEMLDRLNGQLVRHRFRLSQRQGRPQKSLGEHLGIIDAVVSGDPERAAAAMHAHLYSVIEALEETPGGGL